MAFEIIPMKIELHRDAVLNLWRNNLELPECYEERFRWFYEENPSGQAKTCLAVNDKDNEIVSCGSLYPRSMYVNGEKILGGIASDFATNKEHRVFGPAIKLQKQIISSSWDNGFDLNFGFPNKASSGVFLRAGYKLLGKAENYVKVLKSEHKLVNYVKSRLLAKVSGGVIDLIVRLMDLRYKFNMSERFSIEIMSSCDDRFDRLWTNRRGRSKVECERSSAYLSWRYANSKKEKYQFFCLIDKNKDLSGYIAYTIVNNVAIIDDLFAIDMDSTLDHLLLEFSDQMRKEARNSVSITYLGSDSFATKIRKIMFFKREFDRSCVVFLNKSWDDKLRTEILNKNNWFLFDGEMDV